MAQHAKISDFQRSLQIIRHAAKVSPREDPPVAGTSGNGTSSSVSSTNVIVQTSNKIVTPSLIVSEPLFFIRTITYDNYAASSIKSTAVDFFCEDEILSAKSKLISAVEGISGLSIQHSCKTRIGANKSRTSFNDIMNIFTLAAVFRLSCR